MHFNVPVRSSQRSCGSHTASIRNREIRHRRFALLRVFAAKRKVNSWAGVHAAAACTDTTTTAASDPFPWRTGRQCQASRWWWRSRIFGSQRICARVGHLLGTRRNSVPANRGYPQVDLIKSISLENIVSRRNGALARLSALIATIDQLSWPDPRALRLMRSTRVTSKPHPPRARTRGFSFFIGAWASAQRDAPQAVRAAWAGGAFLRTSALFARARLTA